jgi:hypothetical protein
MGEKHQIMERHIMKRHIANHRKTVNQQNEDQTIRPGIRLALVGAMAVTVALIWVGKSKPAPAEATVETAAAVSPLASAEPSTGLFRRVNRPAATPVAENAEPPRWVATSRMARPETGSDTAAPAAATDPRLQASATFDYRAQAEQAAEVVRNTMVPGAGADLTQPPGEGGLVYQGQPGSVGGVPNVITQPGSGGATTSSGSGAQSAGLPSPSAYGGQAQASPVAESGPNGVTAPVTAGTSPPPGSAAQVSQGSGSPGAAAANNPVEAWREAERLRRAYVEQMRLQRIALIAAARQADGLGP